MIPATDIHRRAIELIEQLSLERLTIIVQLLEFLFKPFHQVISDSKEVGLIDVIRHRPPADDQQPLEELYDRCEWDELNDTEHEELIQYENQLKLWKVE